MNVVPDLMHKNHALAGASGEHPWNVTALIDVVRRRGRAIPVGLAACMALGTLYVAASPSLYTATAVVVMDTKQTPPSPSQVSAEPLIDPAVIESQIETLKSERIARNVVDKLKLADDPEFVGSGPDWKARSIAWLLKKPIVAASAESRRLNAVQALEHDLKILRTGHSYLAEIAATTLDPVKSATVANAVADAYIQDQLDGRSEATQRASAWMKQRVDEVHDQADTAEKAAEAFLNQHAADLQAYASGKPKADFAELSAQLNKTELARALYQSRVDKLSALVSANAAGPIPAARLNDLAAVEDPELNGLLDQLRRPGGKPAPGAPPATARPVIENGINTRVAQLIAENRNQVSASEQAILDLSGRVGDANKSLAAGEFLDRQRKSLEATARTDRNNYDSLLNRYTGVTQFMQQQSLPVTEARILTYAQPPLSKSAPRTTVILFLAGVAGLTLGAAAVLIRETLDRRIRWGHQITRTLALPFAGALPVLKRARRPAKPGGAASASPFEAALLGRSKAGFAVLFDSRRPWCSATETLRRVKIAIDQSSRRDLGVVVGIVSSWTGEGKTTLARNLAQLAAETGARVLMIDADFRKPDLSQALASQNAHGLADLVDGTATVEQCTATTDFGFDVLGSANGPPPLHPFDVLGSSRMQRAIVTAQQTYDYVILDLPALLMSVDAQAVARFVDAFVLVAEFGRTTLDDVEHGLAASEVISDRIATTVLNKSRVGKTGAYGVPRGRRLGTVATA